MAPGEGDRRAIHHQGGVVVLDQQGLGYSRSTSRRSADRTSVSADPNGF